MSIATDLLRINNAKTSIRNTIGAAGVNIPVATKIDDYTPYLEEALGTVVEAPSNDVMFIDYDGTILYSYSKSDFLALQQWPSNPSHAGLTAKGWNWSKADADMYVTKYGTLIIGQAYTPSDGATKLEISLTEYDLEVSFGVAGKGEVDWGDETTTETFNNPDIATTETLSHTYATQGKYVISVTFESDSQLKNFKTAPVSNNSYGILTSAKFADGVSDLDTAFLNKQPNLETIIFSSSMFGTNLQNMYAPRLKCVVFPSISTASTHDSNVQNSGVKWVSGSKKWRGSYVYNNSAQVKVFVAEGNTLFNTAFANCMSLREMVFPDSITQIMGDLPASLMVIRVGAATPPTIYGNTFFSLNENCTIYVPSASLQTYKEAQYWSDKASQIEALP